MALTYTVRKIDRFLRFDTVNDDIVVTLLPFSQTPNAQFEMHRVNKPGTSTHTVKIQVDPSAGDYLLSDGTKSIALSDGTPWAMIKISETGESPALIISPSAGGAAGTGNAGEIPVYANDGSLIGSSMYMDDAGQIGVGQIFDANNPPANQLDVGFQEEPANPDGSNANIGGIHIYPGGHFDTSGNWVPVQGEDPANTRDTLYNDDGTLMWNGAAVGSGTGPGTKDYFAVFKTATSIQNSSVYQAQTLDASQNLVNYNVYCSAEASGICSFEVDNNTPGGQAGLGLRLSPPANSGWNPRAYNLYVDPNTSFLRIYDGMAIDATHGADRWTLDTSGNIGISGQSIPRVSLHIGPTMGLLDPGNQGDAYVANDLYFIGPAPGNWYAVANGNPTAIAQTSVGAAAGTIAFYTVDTPKAKDQLVNLSAYTRMVIIATGQVGIGVSNPNPGNILDVSSAGIHITRGTGNPPNITDALYNIGGTLYFNNVQIGGGGRFNGTPYFLPWFYPDSNTIGPSNVYQDLNSFNIAIGAQWFTPGAGTFPDNNALLHLKTGNTYTQLRIENTSTSGAPSVGFINQYSGGTQQWVITVGPNDPTFRLFNAMPGLGSNAAYPFNATYLTQGTSPAVYIPAVGIGTSTPASCLHTKTYGHTRIYVETAATSTATGWQSAVSWLNQSQEWLWYSNTTDNKFRLASSPYSHGAFVGPTYNQITCDVTGFVGIGADSPQRGLHVYGPLNQGQIMVQNTSSNYPSSILLCNDLVNTSGNPIANIQMGIYGSAYGPYGMFQKGESYLTTNATGLNIGTLTPNGIVKFTAGNSTNEMMRISSNANVGIGMANSSAYGSTGYPSGYPAQILHIVSNASQPTVLIEASVTGTQPGFGLKSPATTGWNMYLQPSDNTLRFYCAGTLNSDVVAITPSNSVQIGIPASTVLNAATQPYLSINPWYVPPTTAPESNQPFLAYGPARWSGGDNYGRINLKFNWYISSLGATYLSSAELGASYLQIHTGTYGGNLNFYYAPQGTAGTGPINFTQIFGFDGGKMCWISPRGTASDFFVDKTGYINVGAGQGIQIQPAAPPATTLNTLYNVSGQLYFNGNPVGGAGIYQGQQNYIAYFRDAATLAPSQMIQTYVANAGWIINATSADTYGTQIRVECTNGNSGQPSFGLSNYTAVGHQLWSISCNWNDGSLRIFDGSHPTSSGTDRMTFAVTGAIGINNDSPCYYLHAKGTYMSGDPGLVWHSYGGLTGANQCPVAGIEIANNVELVSGFSYGGSGAGGWSAWFQHRASNNTAQAMALNPSGGNVGVGITGPYYPVHLASPYYQASYPTTTRYSAGPIVSMDCLNEVELTFGWYGASPYPWWLQARGNGNIAYPISLNPTSGVVSIGTLAPNALGYARFEVQDNSAEVARFWGSNTSPATNNTQVRFAGTKANADLWAIGTDIMAGNGSTDFHFHDLTWGALLTLQRAGNVGIGNTSPNAQLSILTVGTASNGIGLWAGTNAQTSSQYAIQAVAYGSAAYSTGVYITVSGATAANYGLRIVNPPAGTSNWAIYSDSPAQVYISGRVAIGTGMTVPATQLHVYDPTSEYTLIRVENAGGSLPGVSLVNTAGKWTQYVDNQSGSYRICNNSFPDQLGTDRFIIMATSGYAGVFSAVSGQQNIIPATNFSTGQELAMVKVATWDNGAGLLYGIGVDTNRLTFGAFIRRTTGIPQMVLTSAQTSSVYTGQLGIGSPNPGAGQPYGPITNGSPCWPDTNSMVHLWSNTGAYTQLRIENAYTGSGGGQPSLGFKNPNGQLWALTVNYNDNSLRIFNGGIDTGYPNAFASSTQYMEFQPGGTSVQFGVHLGDPHTNQYVPLIVSGTSGSSIGISTGVNQYVWGQTMELYFPSGLNWINGSNNPVIRYLYFTCGLLTGFGY